MIGYQEYDGNFVFPSKAGLVDNMRQTQRRSNMHCNRGFSHGSCEVHEIWVPLSTLNLSYDISGL
ncbi:uncharacterized protein MELLADRAFT_93770 [Melampsora larici-populina 98AG31]|uniref:Uncharacterized protein n=1 Tax=Melampsora larici-populina (strain 98AG31 / pathotype 3-4-7) TaxID=747676 RepID=F4S569_MELLP|nr:uncharacterized protein MELLADRAFT_93770 [Melampsora larici-populina 98AG31]EGG00116.1 hypothetical protein MELLADRAFT_93770 [Melampsora larici-populina 98AG31]